MDSLPPPLGFFLLLFSGWVNRHQQAVIDYLHQGLGNELIAPKTTSIGTDPVKCRARLGGLLKFYYREAA